MRDSGVAASTVRVAGAALPGSSKSRARQIRATRRMALDHLDVSAGLIQSATKSMQSHNALAAQSVQRQSPLMPAVRAAAKNSDVLEAGRQQVGCGPRRAPIGLANHHDR